MGLRLSGRCLLIATLVLTVSARLARPPVAAQTAGPVLDLSLYNYVLGIQTGSANPPSVRVVGSDGKLRSETRAEGRPTNGRWRVELPGLSDPQTRILLRPGDRIEVGLDGRSTVLTLPELAAEADVSGDVVNGRAGPGIRSARIALHRDANWFAPPNELGTHPVAMAEDGRFRLDLAGQVDLAPGYYGELIGRTAAGHSVSFGFAPPAITFSGTGPAAYVRANADTRPVLTLRNRIDTELFRSGLGIPIGSALFRVDLYQNGNPDFGAYRPSDGEQVGVELDGLLRLDERLPRALGSIDRASSTVWGLTEPGAALLLALSGDGSPARRLVADAEGHFAVDFAGANLAADTTADFVAWPGGSVARLGRATPPLQQVILYDNEVRGRLPGWGDFRAELWRAGRLREWRESRTTVDGGFAIEFRDAAGQESSIQPDDRILIEPELGRRLELEVPLVTAEVDAAAQRLYGIAPAGSSFPSRVYYNPVSILDPDPFDRETYQVLTTQTDAEGRYQIECDGPPCEMRYGYLGVPVADAQYFLLWLRRPVIGIGVTDRVVGGRGTAGLPVSGRVQGEAGGPQFAFEQRFRPLAFQMPAWELDLSPQFPSGIPSGLRMQIDVNEQRFDLEVPRFEMLADAPRNAVSGVGPPGLQVSVVAYARGDDAARRGARSGNMSIPASGRWTVQFNNFDLKTGDDIEAFVVDDDRYYRWTEDAIAGPALPTAAPSRTPRPLPTDPPTDPPTSEPSPTPRPMPTDEIVQRIQRYLPSLGR
jgi:hypothetical protein